MNTNHRPITSLFALACRLGVTFRENRVAKLEQKSILTVIAALASFGLLSKTGAVVPPPDGGYPGGNTAEGRSALFSLTTGGFNTAVGFLSLRSITTGQLNTAIGAGTLLANTADENTATGVGALLSNTTGSPNTANGALALLSNTTGNNNNAFGAQALESNTTGPFNNAFGNGALASNTTGDRNTAIGEGALLANTTGFQNVAIGVSALRNNPTGHNNIAVGQDSCSQSSGGQFNTAVGSNTLESNTADGNTAIGAFTLINNSTGASNTAIGTAALETNGAGSDNTANGLNALFNNTGSDNTALGFGAGSAATSGANNVYIGAGMVGLAGESNACYIKSIFGQTVDPTTNLAVFVDSSGKLGTTVSSRRFKNGIKPMDATSEAILALRPVTFQYKSNSRGTPQYGLIAEEVAEVNPDLVVRDKEGKPYSVRYDQVNAMLLNEFLKEHKAFVEQKEKVQKLEATVATLVLTVEQQAAQIQKVSTRVDASRPRWPVAVANP